MTAEVPEITFFGEVERANPAALRNAFQKCSWLRLRESGYDSALLLSSAVASIDVQTQQGDGPTYLFSGAMESGGAAARDALSELSKLLTAQKLRYRIEAYGDPDAAALEVWRSDDEP